MKENSKFELKFFSISLFFFIILSGLNELIGIAVGHLYFFIKFKYPNDLNGIEILKTPAFMYNLLPNRQGGVAGFGQAPSSRRTNNNNDDARYRNVGGRGYRLGD